HTPRRSEAEPDADLPRRQATYWASTTTRVMVAKRVYSKRFGETPRTNSLDFKPMALLKE
ncbi:MAG TPA: hypothetical protein VMG63_24705, partial [Terriglobia bacterium]|nr:hypothetical protein [Terriglobia bacterium]